MPAQSFECGRDAGGSALFEQHASEGVCERGGARWLRRSAVSVVALLHIILAPAPSRAEERPLLRLDPVTDAAVLTGSLGVGLTLQWIIGTGEIKPQEPGDAGQLLWIDRWRAQGGDFPDGSIRSNLTLGLVAGYSAVDSVLVEVFDRGDPWYHYVVVYGETVAVTLAITNIVKVAVRRPRPEAYYAFRENGTIGSDTDTALSFFSGHAATAAGLSATAAYLAFSREHDVWEPWAVLAGGIVLTTLVSEARVDEGKHFPTDVIAGAATGAAIGMLVPHLHRVDDDSRFEPRLALVPHGRDGATLAVTGSW